MPLHELPFSSRVSLRVPLTRLRLEGRTAYHNNTAAEKAPDLFRGPQGGAPPNAPAGLSHAGRIITIVPTPAAIRSAAFPRLRATSTMPSLPTSTTPRPAGTSPNVLPA